MAETMKRSLTGALRWSSGKRLRRVEVAGDEMTTGEKQTALG
jgi:hypothetical protein